MLFCVPQVSAELTVSSIPMLDGAAECIAAGVLSSIHSQNAKASAAVENAEQAIQRESWPLLVDPQTGQTSGFTSPPECDQLTTFAGSASSDQATSFAVSSDKGQVASLAAHQTVVMSLALQFLLVLGHIVHLPPHPVFWHGLLPKQRCIYETD